MGISYLNEIIGSNHLTLPNLILDELRKSVKSIFSQSPNDLRKEGIEMAICNYNAQTRTILFSGAKISLWVSRNGIIKEHIADKMPIGLSIKEEHYNLTEINLEKNDTIYLFTDGISDQLGGETGKKYLRKNFVNYLSQIANQPLNNQKISINEMFRDWKGKHQEQTDDILVLGLKV